KMGFKYAVVGFDASDTTDLTACCALMMRPKDSRIYAAHMVWVTEASLKAREIAGDRRGRDAMPYDKWIARALMRVSPGNIIDKRCAIPWLDELRNQHHIYSIMFGYDPWHLGRDNMPVMDAYKGFFGAQNCYEVRQGAQTLSQPMKELRAIYQANELVDNSNPIAEWCRSNVMVRTDVNGEIAPSKKDQDEHNRIDAFAAELDAWVVLKNHMDEYKQIIHWTAPDKGDEKPSET
ncbi:MAG: terminase TerL endonuclease subunit, partial [Sphaerochaetaceae bacterium]